MSTALVIAMANELKSYAIGGGVFLLLLAAMAVLVAIGGGREHS